MASYRQRLIELLGDLRYTKDEVNNLFTILGLAPDDILLNFTTNAEDAKRKVKGVRRHLVGTQGQDPHAVGHRHSGHGGRLPSGSAVEVAAGSLA